MRFFAFLLTLIIPLFAADFKIVPTLSSNPTSGTGLGVLGSLVYHADEGSSPSQMLAMATYTNTDSYNAFVINNMFFDDDQYISNTIAGYVFNNSEFDLSVDIPYAISLPETSANFQTGALIFNQQLLYQVINDLYVGGQVFYTRQEFDSSNAVGRAFLLAKGIEASSLGAVGAVMNYDTRSQKQKLYPREAINATLTYNYSPESLGNVDTFSNVELDYRHYLHGFKSSDVVALQAYGKFCSSSTPDGSLAALGLKNVLRGFSIGQYKARNLAAFQGEYRYEFDQSNFKMSLFGGYANLSGGSEGTNTGNRDGDNGDYYSGGLGVQYVIQKEAGVVYRVDVVSTNKDEQSIYATVNQAF
jgi:hypothetical protein